MYQCPNNCRSDTFHRIVKQWEKIVSDGAGGIEHVYPGDIEEVDG